MRKIIVQEWLSVDGFAEDKNGKLDFFASEEKHDLNKYSDRDILSFIDDVDTILLGRVTYELFAEFWPEASTAKEIIADKLNQTNKIVVSNTLKNAPWGKWKPATILRGDPGKGIKKLKEQPGKDIVVWGSIDLVKLLIKLDLVDEYHLRICPTVTGGGRSIFSDESGHKNLQLLHVKKYDSGLVLLQYEPKKPKTDN